MSYIDAGTHGMGWDSWSDFAGDVSDAWDSGKEAYKKGKAAYQKGKEYYDQGKAVYDQGKAAYQTAKAAVTGGKKEPSGIVQFDQPQATPRRGGLPWTPPTYNIGKVIRDVRAAKYDPRLFNVDLRTRDQKIQEMTKVLQDYGPAITAYAQTTEDEKKKSNTMMYIGIGVLGLGALYLATQAGKSKR